mgnify:CR=1 FL=1
MIFLKLLEPLGIDFPIYHDAAQMVMRGLNPYLYLLQSPGPFNYPPTVFVFIWWLGYLPYFTAGVVWNILSMSSLFFSIYVLLRLSKSTHIIRYFLLFSLIFTVFFFPVKFNFGNGQINTFLLLFCSLGIYFYESKRKNLSAFFFALAITIKLVPIFLVIYFLIKRDWVQIARIAFFILIIALLSLILVPYNFQQVYYSKVFFNALPVSGKDVYYNQSLQGFIARSINKPVIVGLVSGVLSLVILALTFLRGKKVQNYSLWASLFCLILILNPLAWQHHFVFAVAPFILLFADLKRAKNNRFLWSVYFISYVLIAIDIKPFGSWPREINFVLSHQFYGILLLWFIALWKEKMKIVLLLILTLGPLIAYSLNLVCRAKICL